MPAKGRSRISNFRIKLHSGDKRRVALVSRNSYALFVILVVIGSIVTYMTSRFMREDPRPVQLYMGIRDGLVVIRREDDDVVLNRPNNRKETLPTQTLNINNQVEVDVSSKTTISIDIWQRTSVYLFVLIFSEESNRQRRDVIRETWCKRKDFSKNRVVTCLFVLGQGSSNQKYESQVQEEASLFGDVMSFPIIDNIRNSTLKLMNALKLLTLHCKNIKYVLRTEDDVVIHMSRLVEKILPTKNAKHFAGGKCLEEKPHRNKESAYYVSVAEYSEEVYPPVCNSMGYLLSGDLVQNLFDAALHHHLIPLDHVLIALLLAQMKIHPENMDDFLLAKSVRSKTLPRDAMCSYVIVHAHIDTEESVRTLWKAMRDECDHV